MSLTDSKYTFISSSTPHVRAVLQWTQRDNSTPLICAEAGSEEASLRLLEYLSQKFSTEA